MLKLSEAKFAKATPSGGSFFLPGVYEIEVLACKLQESNQEEGLMYIVETKILESNNPDRPKGAIASQVMKLDKHQPAYGNMRGFVAAACGISFDECTTIQCEATAMPEQILAGTVMGLSCTNKPTKKTGGTFTLHTWRLVKMSPAMTALDEAA